MRILHAPGEVSEQLSLSAYGQREIGCAADVLAAEHRFGYLRSPERRPPAGGRVLRNLRAVPMVAGLAHCYDVFHFHCGNSFLTNWARQVDVQALRRSGKTIACEFWGTDIRLGSREAARNPYFEGTFDPAAERRKRALLERWAHLTDGHVVISDHFFDIFLEDHFEHIHVVRQRVDTQRLLPRFPSVDVDEPLIVHNPTSRRVKGTSHLHRALDALRARGLRFRYEEVHNVSHERALEVYERADIFVEQLWGGSHGVSAVEGMSLGKPVVSYILPELMPTYPEGMPVVSANRDTIEAQLELLILDPQRRHDVGTASRRYAEQVHDCRVVARRLVDAYRAMGTAG